MTLRRTILVVLIVLVIVPTAALGASLPTGGLVPCNGPNCTICSLATLAQNLLTIGIYLSVFLSAVLFAWAGWKYLSAGGNPSEINAAKNIFWNVAVGLIIILAAWLIVDTLIHTLTNLGNWNSLCNA